MLVPACQLAVERAVAPTSRGGQEVCDAYIHPDDGRFVSGGRGDVLVQSQRQPTARWLACERHAGVHALAVEHPPMIEGQFDGQPDRCPLRERADAQPVVEGAVLGRLQRDDAPWANTRVRTFAGALPRYHIPSG
jgi:hypothetical protein